MMMSYAPEILSLKRDQVWQNLDEVYFYSSSIY